MKTNKEIRNWKALLDDKLPETAMIKLRGGDGDGDGNGEPPEGPIVKGP